MNRIEISEWGTTTTPHSDFLESDAEYLWRHYAKVIDVEYPTPKNRDEWVFSAKQWIGQIPLRSGGSVLIQPRLPVNELMAILDVAYRNLSVEIPPGIFAAETLPGFFDRLASMLSERMLARERAGVYRSYSVEHGRGARVRGRIRLRELSKHPWDSLVDYDYSNLTADNTENRIVAHALRLAVRARSLTDRTRRQVKRAGWVLSGIRDFDGPADPLRARVVYHRLNHDYRDLHLLSKMIVSNTGPGLRRGSTAAPPFLLDMAKLFQEYVTCIVKTGLGDRYRVRSQTSITQPGHATPSFIPDLWAEDIATGKAVFVADVKYKLTGSPTTDDVSKVAAYAALLGTDRAFLIYPILIPGWSGIRIGSTTVSAASLPLSADPDASRGLLLRSLAIAT